VTPLSRRLAEWVGIQLAEPLPPAAEDKSALHILDATGIAFAARAETIGARIVDAAATAGGSGRSRVLGGDSRGRGGGLGPSAAAFANAALIHALDFDDIHDMARLHPTTVTLPAALAVGDLTGLDEADLIRSVAVGNEVLCRLGVLADPAGSGPAAGWFLTQLFGYIAASVAAGCMLNLDQDELTSAIGLATMQVAGAKQAGYGTGSTARSIYPAFAAEGGVRAALLARVGLIGPESGLDGEAGTFRLYLGENLSAGQADALVDEGAAWSFLATDVKRWPCCRLSHTYVAAALEVRSQLAGKSPGQVTIDVNRSAGRLCEPLDERRLPRVMADAKYSVPFMVAFTLARGAPSLEGLADGVLDDPEILGIDARTDVRETFPDSAGCPRARVTVETASRSASSEVGSLKPMVDDEIRAKFAASLAFARRRRGVFPENAPLPVGG